MWGTLQLRVQPKRLPWTSLWAFVIEQQNHLLEIRVELIQWKAQDKAWEIGIPQEKFKASRGWAQRFMRKNGFLLWRTMPTRLPRDYEAKLVEFQHYVCHVSGHPRRVFFFFFLLSFANRLIIRMTYRANGPRNVCVDSSSLLIFSCWLALHLNCWLWHYKILYSGYHWHLTFIPCSLMSFFAFLRKFA